VFLWAVLARYAKKARAYFVWLYFISAQLLLFLPTALAQARTEPHAMYSRMHGGPSMEVFTQMQPLQELSVGETADGYIYSITIEETQILTFQEVIPSPEDTEDALPVVRDYAVKVSLWQEGLLTEPATANYVFGVTPEYVYYRDANATLAIPSTQIPAWVLNRWDFGELFNYLSLYNQYYTSFLVPTILSMLGLFMLGQGVFYWTVSWLFGQTRRMTTYMTLWERFTVCVYASIPALVPGFLFGIIMPVFNVIIFEVIVLYVAYKIMGEY
jgi:hypothetical protein